MNPIENIPTPPPGFVLEDTPTPPPGFVLEDTLAPASRSVPTPPPGFVAEATPTPPQRVALGGNDYVLPPYIAEREERQKQEENKKESDRKDLLDIKNKTPEEQIRIISEASIKDFQKLSVADIKEQALDAYYRKLGDEQAIEGTPWVDPVMAPVMAGGVGAKLALKSGTMAAAKTGLLSALSALLIEPIAGTLAGEAEEINPVLAPVVNMAIGAGIGMGMTKLVNKTPAIARDTARLLKIKKVGSVSLEDFCEMVMYSPDKAIKEIAKSNLPKTDIIERIRNVTLGARTRIPKTQRVLVGKNIEKVLHSLGDDLNIAKQTEKITLQHWSKTEGIREVDPSMYGTGLKGVEAKRKITDPDDWIDRSYWGIKDSGYKPEAGLGTVKYEAEIPSEKLYDFNSDPLKLRKKLSVTAYEKAIKVKGFKGYYVDSKEKGNVVALFNKQLVAEAVNDKSPIAQAFLKEFKNSKVSREKIRVGSKLWDEWIVGKGEKLLEKVPGGKAVVRAFDYDYRGSLKDTAKYLHSREDMYLAQRVGGDYAVDLGQRLNKLSETVQIKVGAAIKGERVVLDESTRKLAEEAKTVFYELGKQAVDTGLLSEKTFFKNAGRYMPRLYTKHEYTSLLKQFKLPKPMRLDMSRFSKKGDIPEAIRKEMGEILTPGYPVAKGIVQLTHDISMARFFNGIATNSDWAIGAKAIRAAKLTPAERYLQETGKLPPMKNIEIPPGWRTLPVNRKLGSLSGASVHPEIYEDMTDAIHVAELPEKIWRKSLGMWKFGKVILSPKTHMRNLFSNSILAHCGGMSMPKQPYYLAKAAKAMCKDSKYYDIAKRGGLLSNTFVQHELRGLYGAMPAEQCNPHKIYKMFALFRKSGAKAAHLYEAEEQWFKIAKMIHNIEKRGMSNAEAVVDAEKWLFNYSKVTKFQDKFRSKWYGAPFATFTFKALPRIAETAATKPWRLALPLAMIHGLEEHARQKIKDTRKQTKAKRKLLPEWMKGSTFATSNFARVPVVDDSGREYYLNLTYMLPWGDIGESGSFMGIPGGVMPLSQPFVKEPMQQILNYDNFWDEKIVKDTDIAGKNLPDRVISEAKARGKHLFQTMAPTPAIDLLKIHSAAKGKPDYRGRKRPTGAVLADTLAGVKMYPVDYAEQMQRKINKLNPQKGSIARKLTSQIRTLYTKKKHSKEKNYYQRQIDIKLKQLQKLGEETKNLSRIYRETK
jgi:hypothetical protein